LVEPTEPQVFDHLVLLLRNAGRLVTRHESVDEVWKGRIVSDPAISARIAAARKAVGDNGKSKPSFAPWPGAGFNWWRTSVWMVSRPLQKNNCRSRFGTAHPLHEEPRRTSIGLCRDQGWPRPHEVRPAPDYGSGI
jgi:DNA-binding winged helix-turn-helix (wHTH) protein